MPKRKKNTTRREFSMTRPIMYQGEYYPSADSLITDENGRKTKGRIFADANGQYYTLDENGNLMDAMPVNNLDGVTVTAQNKQVLPTTMLDNYLTMSNDDVRVNNLPHRSYNSHLEEQAQRGAREHALWDREHPNLSSWRDAATAVPFAVASAPFVLGGGQGLLGTAAGQAARNGLVAFMENPYVAGANDLLGLGFATKGATDVAYGKFTPETALDLAGGAGLMFKGLNAWDKSRMAAKSFRDVAIPSESEVVVPMAEEASSVRTLSELPQEINIPEVVGTVENAAPLNNIARTASTTNRLSAEEERLLGLTDAERRLLSYGNRQSPQETTAPARLWEEYNNGNVLPTPDLADSDSGLRDIILADLANQSTAPSETATSMFGNRAFELSKDQAPLESMPRQSDYLADNMDSYWDDLWSWERRNNQPPRTRKKGERPYTDEEISSLVSDEGMLMDPRTKYSLDSVETGAHGEMFIPAWNANQDYDWILKNHINAAKNQVQEMRDILADNPKGRSGVIIDTHIGDTSMDSTPLAYKVATMLGKKFKPMATAYPTVRSNSFGYNKAFKLGYSSELKRAEELYKANPNYKATILRDNKGNMTAYELTDENGTFQIPLNTRQEVLDIMNDGLHKFNEHYGTSYPDITPYRSRQAGEHWDGKSIRYKDVTPETMYPWDFGEVFEVPNIYGIAYKQGGRIKRKLLTQF